MPRKPPYERIAITLPQETLRAADELAALQDRSRSWIVAEAVRQYAASQRRAAEGSDAATRLGPSRLAQLQRDLALSPEARVLEGEELAAIVSERAAEPLRRFATYDDYIAWRRERDVR